MPTESNRPPRHSERLIGNRIGENNADNEYSSASVVANADGSMLERLEYLQGLASPLATYNGSTPTSYDPVLGYPVTKQGDIASAPDDLFTVTGLCMVTLMIGVVASALATSTSLAIHSSTGGVVIAASTTITSDPIGELYMVVGDPDLALNGASTPNNDVIMPKDGHFTAWFVNNDKIVQTVNGAGTGLINWTLFYKPMGALASNNVVAAA